MNILHAADLHLSRSEKDYSFQVLAEILLIAKKEGAGAVLFAGDLFDSWAEAKALRDEFRLALETLPPGCSVFYLPGNHELLGAGKDEETIARLDLGRARLLTGKPFSLTELSPDVELLSAAYVPGNLDYREWKVPQKTKALRILIAHGTVPGTTYTGPDEEGGGRCVIDPDLFSFLGIDYAALGHIHAPSARKIGLTQVVYPGSARVWREGEYGPRGVVLFKAELPLVPARRVLKTAGEFRDIRIPVEPKGDLSPLPETYEKASARDFLRLELAGFVEEEKSVIEKAEVLKARLEKKHRRISLDTKGLDLLSGISTHPLAIEFLKKWAERFSASRNEEEKEILTRARLRGLLALKDLLESRK